MPIKLEPKEKELTREYFGKFGMNPMTKKIFLCAYYGTRKFDGYITLEQFLHSSLSAPDLDMLIKRWMRDDNGMFFGFNRKIIKHYDITDLEAHIISLTSGIPDGQRCRIDIYSLRAQMGITEQTVPVHRNNNI